MQKYGIDNFKIEEIEQCSVEDAEIREKYWIEYYGSFKNGYNATLGGDGKSYIDRELVFNTYKKIKNCAEVARLLNINQDTVKHIMKEEFHIQILSGQEVVKQKTQKPVIMINKDTNEKIRVFSSVNDAERFLQINYTSHITEVCNGKRKTFKGYKWEWLKK